MKSRIRENVNEAVVFADFFLRDATNHYHARTKAKTCDAVLQNRFDRTTTDQEEFQPRAPITQKFERLEEDFETFVVVKRTQEANHFIIDDAELSSEARVTRTRISELFDIDSIWDHE